MWNPATQSIENELSANDLDRDAAEQEEDDQVPWGALMDIAPWAITTLVHAALVLLAVWLVWLTVAQTNDQFIMIPNTTFDHNPGTPLESKKLFKVSVPSPARRSVARITASSTDSWMCQGFPGPGYNNLVGPAAVTDVQVSSFFGTSIDGKQIAYVIDASGSLIDTLPFVISELKRSIGGLSEEHSFTVVFFMGGKAVEVPPYGFKKATNAIKRQTLAWIDPGSGNIVPQGKTNPLPAIKRALGYKPQLMYLLSDNITGNGKFELHTQFVLDEIRAEMKRLNSITKINTIQFFYPDPLTKIGMKPTMQLIADEMGGHYTFVDRRTIGLE